MDYIKDIDKLTSSTYTMSEPRPIAEIAQDLIRTMRLYERKKWWQRRRYLIDQVMYLVKEYNKVLKGK